jgi:hypothetical protein
MFSLNEELSKDPLIKDEIIDVTSLKMKSIKNKWRNLSEMVEAKSERCGSIKPFSFRAIFHVDQYPLSFKSNLVFTSFFL